MVLGGALKGAEDALGGADVGVVDVAVDDVCAECIAVDGSAARVGPSTEFKEFLFLEQRESLLGRQAEGTLRDIGEDWAKVCGRGM